MASNDDRRGPLERSTFDRLVSDEPEARAPGSVPPKALDVVPFDWSRRNDLDETPGPTSRRNTERGVGPSEPPPGPASTPPPGPASAPLPDAASSSPRDAAPEAPAIALVDATDADPRTRAEGALPDVSPRQKPAWETSDPRVEPAEPLGPLDERETRKRVAPRNVLGRHVVAGIYTVETDYDWSDATKARIAEEEIVRAKEAAAQLEPGSDALLRLATEMRAKYGALIGPEADAVDATSQAAIASLLVDVAKEAAVKEAALEAVKLEAQSERALRLDESRRAESLARSAKAERARADERDEAAREARDDAARARADKAKVVGDLEAARRQLASRSSDAGTTARKIPWIPILLFLSLFVIAYLIWLAIWATDVESPAPSAPTAATGAPAGGVSPPPTTDATADRSSDDVARAQSTSDDVRVRSTPRAAAQGGAGVRSTSSGATP